MSKPRMPGETAGFVPNSQADRRRGNRTFQHHEYQKEVQKKKDAEMSAAIDRLNKAIREMGNYGNGFT